MEIFSLVGLAILVLFTMFIMPWVNYCRISSLQDEVKRLKKTLSQIDSKPEKVEAEATKATPKADIIKASYEPRFDPAKYQSGNPEPAKKAKAAPAVVFKEQVKSEHKVGFEQQFGTRLPVWIGGIALALAGFYLVKYSIEKNLISPAVRLMIGGVFGVALLYCGKWIRSKPDFSNGVRIAQSLAGAGIAVLYVVSFASVRIYDLIPMFAGFAAMAAVTAVALVLSLRHGPPIALMGLAGGFLTPALLGSEGGNVFTLFIYLYFTASGLLVVVRKTKWWWLSIPTIIASLCWVVLWMLSSYQPGDSLWLGLFLVGISATIAIGSRKQYEEDGGGTYAGMFKLTSILNYIGLGGSLMMMGIITGKAGFGFMEWSLFGLLAIGGVGMAYFNDKLYGFIPWVSMAVTAVMLSTWGAQDYSLFALTLAIFAAIYIVSGYFLMFRSAKPLLWAGLTAAASLAYYLLAYYKLHVTTLFIGIPFFWGAVAVAFACGAIYALINIKDNLANYERKEHLYTIFSVVATSFMSLALCIELDREFLSVAIAFEMLAIAWINSKVSIRALRPIIAVVAFAFGMLLIPQIILMLQLTAYSLIEMRLHLQQSVPIVKWPLFQLGVPALMFLGSAWLLRKQKDDRLIRIFETAVVLLFAVMGYYLTRNIMHPTENVLFVKAGFLERGIITNILFVFGLGCMWCGRGFERMAYSQSGAVVCAVAMFRVVYFDMFIHNPLFNNQVISGLAVFNSLLLPFGLPLVWAYFVRKELICMGKEKWIKFTGEFILAALFVLISLNVRHVFHGEHLNLGITTNAEIYSYSVAWLLLSIALLFGGIVKGDKMLRYASLSLMLFTVGKVFLYDASELEGLYRVFSFFGLGLCLIGISYFYTRFVFGED